MEVHPPLGNRCFMADGIRPMIERHAGQQQLVCACGFAQRRSYERDEFDVMIADARAEGWSITKSAGEWQHDCPSCTEAARPSRQGGLF